jgi:hypothetical protein
MKTGGKAHASKWFFLLKALFDALQHRHILPGPENPFAPTIGQAQIFNIVVLSCHYACILPFPLLR